MNSKIIVGYENMKPGDIVRLLKMTYWADKRPEEQIELSCKNSSCYGLMVEEKLVGFARVISDYATFYYLCDVVIDPAYRGNGLGTKLVSHIESQPEFSGLTGMLKTRDAHNLYREFGYEVLNDKVMVKGM